MRKNTLPEDADTQEGSVPVSGKEPQESGARSLQKTVIGFMVFAILGVVFYTTDLSNFFKGILTDPVTDEDQGEIDDTLSGPTLECLFDQPSAYWSFEEIEGIQIKDVINKKTGTLKTPESGVTEGIVGNALISSPEEGLTIQDLDLWDVEGKDTTISVWAKIDQVDEDGKIPLRYIADHFIGGYPGAGWLMWVTGNGDISFDHRNQDVEECLSENLDQYGNLIPLPECYIMLDSTSDFFADLNWHNITVVLDEPVATLYVDGQVAHTDFSYKKLNDRNEPLKLGGIDGKIDEFLFFERALTQPEIEQLYNNALGGNEFCTWVEPEPEGPITYYWSFDEGAGVIANDSDANGNHGILNGTESWVDGKAGKAFNFTNGYFLLENPITIEATQPVTFSAWVKFDEVGQGQYIISSEKVAGFNEGNWIFMSNWVNEKQIAILSFMDRGLGGGTDKPAYHKYKASNTPMEPDTWYNLVMTYDGQDTSADNIKIYLDGEYETSSQQSSWSEGWTSISDKTAIGIRAGNLSNNKFLGTIDELKLIIGEALTADQVKEMYDAVNDPVEPLPITCTNNEVEYEVGATFDAGDDCNTCTCGEDGQISCTEEVCEPDPVICEYNSEEHQVGSTFDATDDCNVCICGTDGTTTCTEAVCEPDPGAEGEGEDEPVTCEYNSEEYEVGSTFDSTDDCNICICETDGGITCTDTVCQATDPDTDPDPTPDPITCTYESETYSIGATVYVDDCNTCFCGNNGLMSCTDKTCDEDAPATQATPTTPLPTTSPYCISGTDKTIFIDLDEGDVKTSAEYLSQLIVDNIKVVGGYDTAFGHEYRPNKTISRAEFAKILLYLTRCDDVRQCNADYSGGPLPKIGVEDVDTASWYYNVVRCGLQYDVFYPDTNNEFRPEVPITRAEATDMIVRAANIDYSDEDGSAKFSDVEEDHYYNETIGAASEMKVINGYADGEFKPENPISRGEAALILTRYLYQKSLTE